LNPKTPSPTMADTRPPITCHVLDTTIGLPAPSIPVSLTLMEPASPDFRPVLRSTTNSDGRCVQWLTPEGKDQNNFMHSIFNATGREMTWVLRFETKKYWENKGVKPFFPDVQLTFVTQGYVGQTGEKGHWHVPLLLGPFNYTTYRGS